MFLGRQRFSGEFLSVGAPYLEKEDHQENRLDRGLLKAWGSIAPRMLSKYAYGRFDRLVRRVDQHEGRLIRLSGQDLRDEADQLRARMIARAMRPEETALAFALTREAARRHAGMSHFRVQLAGGATMMGGALAEMQTGEGKTLTAALPAVAAALMGLPVHVVTVNDYLADRDARLLRPVYNALGLTVGLIQHGQDVQDRQRAYAQDITYCTNKELVFDYLRDRLTLGGRRGRVRLQIEEAFNVGFVQPLQRLLLRGLQFAVIDEADSVLVDEARTPVILSGARESHAIDAGLCATALDIARQLENGGDFHIFANERRVRLTEQGKATLAALVSGARGLLAIQRACEELIQHALAALHLYQRDVQYIVADGKVQIVDEYTGRTMPDRSWEHGVHQLIEAKEHCTVTGQPRTLAQITYQRFFRRYGHLCGMTGTAMETAGELRAVYGLHVVRIPPNRPSRRINLGGRLYPRAELKWNAIVESAAAATCRGRAILIGTRSVGASERVGALLRQAGLNSVILNARQDRDEAEIVARAGEPGRITVATNMAGRGTDIKLHPAVREAGGLHVILTEYHESQRIDRQLFGRAGRQGDPGSYESIVALDDELFRRFAADRLLKHIASGATRRCVPRWFAHVLKSFCQFAAERHHMRARRITLDEDHRIDQILGFAGVE
jgi:preprotein translocase subunit SecA